MISWELKSGHLPLTLVNQYTLTTYLWLRQNVHGQHKAETRMQDLILDQSYPISSDFLHTEEITRAHDKGKYHLPQ